MSMIGNVAGATDAQIAALHAEPSRVTSFLYDAEPLEHLGPMPRTMDVDKAWHAIHVLLTGEAWESGSPLAFFGSGGREIGDTEVGYGPARSFSSDEVRALADALAPIDVPALFARWNVQTMRDASVYGIQPHRPDEEVGYVGAYYEDVKRFINGLAEDGLGMIVFIN